MRAEGKTVEEIALEMDLTIPEIKEMITRYIVSTYGDNLTDLLNKLESPSIDKRKFLDLVLVYIKRI